MLLFDPIGFISHCITGINDDSYELNLVGDFNFPDIDWETSTVLPGDTKESRHFNGLRPALPGAGLVGYNPTKTF